jgi:hypothetical protein
MDEHAATLATFGGLPPHVFELCSDVLNAGPFFHPANGIAASESQAGCDDELVPQALCFAPSAPDPKPVVSDISPLALRILLNVIGLFG